MPVVERRGFILIYVAALLAVIGVLLLFINLVLIIK